MWQDEGTAAVAMACERAETGVADGSAFFFELGKRGDMRRARAAERFTRLAELSSGIIQNSPERRC